ncbi:MAG: ABC transporter ATP-binding protein [Chloroflexota bacterium]|nr:ABC transporter ATP-binding protein [Chloroflexota bacterium]
MNFTLDVADGEFMVLLGPSGCGKTTALRILAGLEEPTAGAVTIAGRDVTDLPPRQRDVAMVFQNYALYPHMSVYDNIAFGLRMRRIPRGEIDRMVREAAATLAIADVLARKPGALSGGQRQRVALARAIVRRPRAFLMDEPLSNLDAKLRAQTRVELIRLHRQLQTTVLYVTHDQVEAMTMGHRIAVLERGRLQQVGEPRDIYERPANLFVAEFIGSPSMSFFRGPLRQTDGGGAVVDVPHLPFALDPAQAAPARAAGCAEVVVGVRPEHIVLAEDFGERYAAATFEADIDVVESLGNELHVSLMAQGRGIIARLSAGAPVAAGEARRFAIAPEHLLLFEPEHGTRLG